MIIEITRDLGREKAQEHESFFVCFLCFLAANIQSERDTAGKPDLTFTSSTGTAAGKVERGCYHSERGRIGRISTRIVEVRCVGDSEHLHPELKLHPLRDPDITEDACVKIE